MLPPSPNPETVEQWAQRRQQQVAAAVVQPVQAGTTGRPSHPTQYLSRQQQLLHHQQRQLQKALLQHHPNSLQHRQASLQQMKLLQQQNALKQQSQQALQQKLHHQQRMKQQQDRWLQQRQQYEQQKQQQQQQQQQQQRQPGYAVAVRPQINPHHLPPTSQLPHLAHPVPGHPIPGHHTAAAAAVHGAAAQQQQPTVQQIGMTSIQMQNCSVSIANNHGLRSQYHPHVQAGHAIVAPQQHHIPARSHVVNVHPNVRPAAQHPAPAATVVVASQPAAAPSSSSAVRQVKGNIGQVASDMSKMIKSALETG